MQGLFIQEEHEESHGSESVLTACKGGRSPAAREETRVAFQGCVRCVYTRWGRGDGQEETDEKMLRNK